MGQNNLEIWFFEDIASPLARRSGSTELAEVLPEFQTMGRSREPKRGGGVWSL